jgi:hypothetical protein
MSDFNEVVKRVATDRSFRADMLKDLNGTLAAHNYTITSAEQAELAQLDNSKLDQLDETLLEQVVGGALTTLSLSTSYSTLPLLSTSLNTLNTQNYFTTFTRSGTVAASGSW